MGIVGNNTLVSLGKLFNWGYDKLSYAIKTASPATCAVHEGRAWDGYASFSVLAGGTKYLQLKTNDDYLHIPARLVHASEPDVELQVMRLTGDETITDGTTEVSFANANDNYQDTATHSFQLFTDPTVIGVGAPFYFTPTILFGVSGNPVTRQGGSSSEGEERVFQANATYLLKVTATYDTDFYIRWRFYQGRPTAEL